MARKSHAYNYVYLIVNKINLKYYIGVHSTDDLDDNYLGSGSKLIKDRKKYGDENFIKKVLYFFDTVDEAYEAEEELVTQELVDDQNCYNCIIGGLKGFYLTNKEDIKPKKSKKKNITVYDSKNLSKGWFTVQEDNEHLLSGRYIAKSSKSVVVHDINNVDRGKFKCPENDPNLLLGRYIHHKSNHKNTTITKKRSLSKEHKEKIREFNAKRQKGESNSQYGTCWISNLDLQEVKKIKKEDISIWVNAGWIRGRIVNFEKYKEKLQKRAEGRKTRGTINRIMIHNKETKKEKFIFPNELERYAALGFEQGAFPKKKRNRKFGVKRIYNPILDREKQVLPEEIDSWLSNGEGWVLGTRRNYNKSIT